MRLCILDNDILDGYLGATYGSFGAMFIRLFRDAGADWSMDVFNTQQGQYPTSFENYDAVLLTGSGADSFSDEPWVVELRQNHRTAAQEQETRGRVLWPPAHRPVPGRACGPRTVQAGAWARPMTGTAPNSHLAYPVCVACQPPDQVFELPPAPPWPPAAPIARYVSRWATPCSASSRTPNLKNRFSAHLLDKRRELLGEAL